ncbi:hypothetical protein HHK36_015696 [Tetracentron sinense]|uniref:RRM domain-containing protein n=1 Tax=Tetracentron sinense TaxID=13715 RepID=A0A834Z2P4_TETSI|nr:hypothetical protein HHK36_015696 [Tetracentron sinense]
MMKSKDEFVILERERCLDAVCALMRQICCVCTRRETTVSCTTALKKRKKLERVFLSGIPVSGERKTAMGETGSVRFPGNLDPRAQEFRPRNPSPNNQLLPPQIYYPYTSSYPSTAVQVMPFYDGGIGYHQPSSPSAVYVRPTGVNPPLPAPSTAATRTLLLSSVPTDVSEETVRRELEVFGEVRAVQMERLQEGIVTVHFYDLRDSQAAMAEIREQHMQQQSRLRKHYNNTLLMRNLGFEGGDSFVPVPSPARGLIAGCAVWAQFTMPTTIVGLDGHNLGTLVVFNLASGVSASKLKEIFEAFGPVKELRETPSKRNQRFVEFFDIRNAARALSEMNGKEIHRKHVVVEFSRPGGHGGRLLNAITTTSTNINPVNNSITKSSCNTRNAKCPPLKQPLSRRLFGRSISNVSSRSHLYQTHVPTSKSDFSRRSASWNSNDRSNYGAVGSSMASLSLSVVGNGIESERDYDGSSRRNAKKSNNNDDPSATTKQKQQQTRSRSWKGRQKSLDTHLLINEDAMIESNCRDSRTTIMIKNIPNKYSQKLFLNMLDNHCLHYNEQITDGDDQPLSSYDFVYLPIDFNNKCNVGYGFVNLTTPQAKWRLYKAFHLQPWEVFNSRKICEVTYARLQGLEALKEHFKNSKFACETDEYLPVVFNPPRDGKQVTEPQPVVGHAVNKKLITGSSSSSRLRVADLELRDDKVFTTKVKHSLSLSTAYCNRQQQQLPMGAC